MTTTRVTRKARFKAALALADMTAAQWATEQGVTREHLHLVLTGQRDSAPLNEKIDDFIAKQQKQLARAS